MRTWSKRFPRGVFWQIAVLAILAPLAPAQAQRDIYGPLTYVVIDDGTIVVLDGNPPFEAVGDPIHIDQVNASITALAANPDGTRLYVASSCSATSCIALGGVVSVVDTASHAVVATINEPLPAHLTDSFHGLHGIAVTVDGREVYVSAGNGGFIFAIDTATNTVAGPPIMLGDPAAGFGNPTHLVVSPDGTRVYAADDGEDVFVWVISTVTNTVADSIWMSGETTENLALSPDGTRLYVTDDVGYLWVVDTATDRVVTSFLVGDADGSTPDAVAVTPDGKRAFVLTDVVLTIDTATNRIVGAPPILSPSAIAITPRGDSVFVAAPCGAGPGCSTPQQPALWVFDPFYTGFASVIPLSGNRVGPIVIAPVPQPTPTATPPATARPTTAPTRTPATCAGDCNGDGRVTVDELIHLINIALGSQPLDECANFAECGNLQILCPFKPIVNALEGCPREQRSPPPTPTAPPSPTPTPGQCVPGQPCEIPFDSEFFPGHCSVPCGGCLPFCYPNDDFCQDLPNGHRCVTLWAGVVEGQCIGGGCFYEGTPTVTARPEATPTPTTVGATKTYDIE
jgi:DNA-binding beta-propeller fold protein YncE